MGLLNESSAAQERLSRNNQQNGEFLEDRRWPHVECEYLLGRIGGLPWGAANAGHSNRRQHCGRGRCQRRSVCGGADQTSIRSRLSRIICTEVMRCTQRRELTRVQRLREGRHQENTDAEGCAQCQEPLARRRSRVTVSHQAAKLIRCRIDENSLRMYHYPSQNQRYGDYFGQDNS